MADFPQTRAGLGQHLSMLARYVLRPEVQRIRKVLHAIADKPAIRLPGMTVPSNAVVNSKPDGCCREALNRRKVVFSVEWRLFVHVVTSLRGYHPCAQKGTSIAQKLASFRSEAGRLLRCLRHSMMSVFIFTIHSGDGDAG